MVNIDVQGTPMYFVLSQVAGTNDFDVRLTDSPGVARAVNIAFRVSSTELKQVLTALEKLAPATPQEKQVMNLWAARVP
jgi:hypothetical protein